MEWENPIEAAGIQLQKSAAESHNALGAEQRYHVYLRHQCFNKMRGDSFTVSIMLSIAIAMKAVNDNARPSGLVPTLLVFGLTLLLPVCPAFLPAQVERINAAVTARKEVNRIISRKILETALSHEVLRAADSCVKVHYQVLMYN